MVTFVNSATNSINSATSISLSLPSGLQNGDLLIATVVQGSSAVTITAPSGWTAIDGSPKIVGNQVCGVWYCYYTTSMSTPAWTFSSAAKTTGSLVAYRGVDQTAPFASQGVGGESTTSLVLTAPSITTTAANQEILAIFSNRVSSMTSQSVPAGMTARAVVMGSGGGATSSAIYSETRSSIGVTGDRTSTYDQASSKGYGILLALKEGLDTTLKYAWTTPLILGTIPPPTVDRFPGDPGAGNFYSGWDGGPQTFGALSNGMTLSPAPLSVYHDYSTATNAKVQASKLDIGINNNMIPSQSFKLGTYTTAQITSGAADADIADSIATVKARAPWPIWLCYYHEPEDNFSTESDAAGYRAAYRYIVQAFRNANVTNVAWQPIFMCPWTFNGSGRDWRWWHADWNGGKTNTSADWYSGVNKMMDLMGLDVYNPMPGGTTSYEFSTMVDTARSSFAATGFPGAPITIPEFGMNNKATPQPNWLTWCNSAIVYAKANDIVSIQYWNHNANSDYNFDSTGDPDGMKLQGWHAISNASVVCPQGGA